jgi:hypothetical protein
MTVKKQKLGLEKYVHRSLLKEGFARWKWQTAWLEMDVNVGFLM